jgi:D-alanine--poly(phosphoribitol) ligase subunit 1
MASPLVQHYADESACRAPDRIAVLDGTVRLGFDELVASANRLAHCLKNLGVVRQDRVAICLPRSVHCLIAILGVLKADAVYVPIDPKAPAERSNRILEDCRPKVFIGDPTILPRFASFRSQSGGAVICLGGFSPAISNLADVNETELGKYGHHPPCYRNEEADLAYILYTSGSTGRPKGVMISHGNVRNYIDWAADCFAIGATDHILGTAPFYFDMSVFDIFCSLKAGASLCIAKEDLLLFPEKLARFIEAEGITVWKGISSLLMYMERAGIVKVGRMPSLKKVLFGGEALPTRSLIRWMEAFPEKTFFNVYGPTETTGISLYYPVERIPAGEKERIPIGKPGKGAKVYLLNDDGRPVGQEEVGELCIAGSGLGRGYLNDEDKTLQAFITHSIYPGGPIYRTGDLAFCREDGNFEFIGRKDRQVKIMGYRIDLFEIEEAMISLEEVEEAAVIFTSSLEKKLDELVGFYVPRQDLTPAVLADRLRKKLPVYMVPKRLVRLDRMPRCSRGKISRQELSSLVAAAGVTC